MTLHCFKASLPCYAVLISCKRTGCVAHAVQVVVAEAAPRFDGHRMARQLADATVQTTLIADSAVFAMMARANKVCLHRVVYVSHSSAAVQNHNGVSEELTRRPTFGCNSRGC
jgi:methylthioribose-1-phosphate isomerase